MVRLSIATLTISSVGMTPFMVEKSASSISNAFSTSRWFLTQRGSFLRRVDQTQRALAAMEPHSPLVAPIAHRFALTLFGVPGRTVWQPKGTAMARRMADAHARNDFLARHANWHWWYALNDKASWPEAFAACFQRRPRQQAEVDQKLLEAKRIIKEGLLSEEPGLQPLPCLGLGLDPLLTADLQGFLEASANEVRQSGVDRFQHYCPRVPTGDGGFARVAQPMAYNAPLLRAAVAFAFGASTPTVALSKSPSKGVTEMCIPYIMLPGGVKFGMDPKGYENMLGGLIMLTWASHGLLHKDTEALVPTLVPHKAEAVELDGTWWYHKACESDRIACALINNSLRGEKPSASISTWGAAAWSPSKHRSVRALSSAQERGSWPFVS